MIWNFIRDFIVEHITGGCNSTGTYFECFIGYDKFDEDVVTNAQLYYNVGGLHNGTNQNCYITISDWLATTLTTICMCLIVAFAIWLVIWVFKAVAHAFLLRR